MPWHYVTPSQCWVLLWEYILHMHNVIQHTKVCFNDLQSLFSWFMKKNISLKWSCSFLKNTDKFQTFILDGIWPDGLIIYLSMNLDRVPWRRDFSVTQRLSNNSWFNSPFSSWWSHLLLLLMRNISEVLHSDWSLHSYSHHNYTVESHYCWLGELGQPRRHLD